MLGVIYVLALPNSLFDQVVGFFGSFTTAPFPGTSINLPVPVNPQQPVFYTAVFQFCLGIALLQILVLTLRIIWRSPVKRTAETTGNLVFWSGTSIVVAIFLNASTNRSEWFAFWGAFLLVVGFSLLARAAVIFIKKK
uniref:Putative serine phosphatase n=1 Tax=uncultured crenarchaeote MCG TaxID=529375 RepID=B2YI60_9CREN|nr:putative serine phosphatase [uncultured crenarchaeote MCG]